MKWCARCVLPDSRPGVVLDEEGICGACSSLQIKHKEINWEEREADFSRLVDEVKSTSRHFDCLIPVSGGKDSTWQVIKCLEYGLRPLAVTWKTPARTPIGQQNLDNLVNLGVDHIDWQVNPQVEKLFLYKAYKKFGATAIPMHMALTYIPLNIAYNFNIPLVVYGENSAFEYGSGGNDTLKGHKLNKEWLKNYGVTHGTTASDWIDEELTRKHLSSYFGPSDEDLEEKDISAIFLGTYFKWDVEVSLKSAVEHGFKVSDAPRTGVYNFADIDDDFISIHHWLKWYKFGITRSFDNLSLEIREGRISRDQAIDRLIQEGECRPVEDIRKFCDFIEITEDEFYAIAETFRNHDIWEKTKDKWVIRDYLTNNWEW